MPPDHGTAAMIRPARPDDAWDLAVAHVRSMQATYRDIVSSEHLEALTPETNVERKQRMLGEAERRVLVAEIDGRAVGFAALSAQTETTCAGPTGELQAIYLDPAYWHRGIGQQLWDGAVDLGRRDGWHRMVVRSAAANLKARRFYERMGCVLEEGSEDNLDYLGVCIETVRFELVL